MDKVREEQINKMIEYIIVRKFPNSSENERRAISGRENVIGAVAQFKAELNEKPNAEIQQLYVEECKKEKDLERRRAEQIEQQRFFNQARARANLEEAIKLPYWTLDETVAYSLNKNPSIVNWETIKRYADESLFVKEYMKRKHLIERALEMNDLRYYNSYASPAKKFKPAEFMSWAINIFENLPEELEKTVTRIDWEARCKELEQELEKCKGMLPNLQRSPAALTKELETKNQIIAAMAKKHYRYDPNVSKNSAITNIKNLLDELGISLNEDTIRKHLKEASELLPRDN